METNYEQFLPPLITESELVPVEALETLAQERNDATGLTLEQEGVIKSGSVEDLRNTIKTLNENPYINHSLFCSIRKAVRNTIRKVVHEHLNITDLSAKQRPKPDKITPYKKLTKVLKFPRVRFPQPCRPQMPEPNRTVLRPRIKKTRPSYLKLIK